MHTLRGWIFYLWFSITLIPAATTVLLLWPFAGAEFRYEKVALVLSLIHISEPTRP